MAEYLGLNAVGWDNMLKAWWQKVLAGLLLAAAVLGSMFLLFLLLRKLLRYWRSRKTVTSVPSVVRRYISDLRDKTPSFHRPKTKTKKASFGVFLGELTAAKSQHIDTLLSRWDILVLDPFQDGVFGAASRLSTSSHILGRLDISEHIRSTGSGTDETIRALGMTVEALWTKLMRQDGAVGFAGVLLSNWQAHFAPPIFNELMRYIATLGLVVYLEVAGPSFLTDSECRELDFSIIEGLVCRNGTVLPNGERRNFYQMENMRRALRAVAKESGIHVIMWETVNDGVELEHATIKRSFDWCRYNNAIHWIGPQTALTDAEVAVEKTVMGEPLGALMWLKNEGVLKSLSAWDSNYKVDRKQNLDIYNSLQEFIPNLAEKLTPVPLTHTQHTELSNITMAPFEGNYRSCRLQSDPLSVSSRGYDYTGLGCFQLGLDCSTQDFEDIVETQRRLAELNLLERVKVEDLHEIVRQLETLARVYLGMEDIEDELQAVNDLCQLIRDCNGQEDDGLKVYVALHSGLRTSLSTQFWGIHDVTGITTLYISAKTPDLAGTILHTFMSSRGCTRTQCFSAENLLFEQTGCSTTAQLAPRLKLDIEQLTPAEAILLLQRVQQSASAGSSGLLAKIESFCEHQLLEVPSLTQLRALSSAAYLRNEVTVEEIIAARITWYREQGYQHPDPSTAISVFKTVDIRVREILMNRQGQILSQLQTVLKTVIEERPIDPSADIFALSLFCAFRKLALNEVYMEVLDRNPLPNGHSDQAACFAEMFATGSQCGAYFNMTPNALGKIIADKYTAYYKDNQPPLRDDHSTELPTAYASKQVDIDPNAVALKLPLYYQISFLGIFAVPALVDILLLTTIGRGLYLTAYMTQDVKLMATTALMISLFLVGAVGTWISSGGSYYLHSMAFPAMNMYVLSRLTAGVAVCVAGGFLAFLIIGVVKSFYLGIIFFLYFFFLSTYLTLLATLAIYQIPGFMFQSGRMIIMMCMPILLISPLITLWLGHDVLVYLCVMAGFITALLVGLRKVVAQWSTWYQEIPCVTDTEIVQWYIKRSKTADPNSDPTSGMADLGATGIPRRALLEEVVKEWNRRPWRKPTQDEFVLKLAKGYDATKFLLDWYCKYSRTQMPFPYSPTWNLQCKASIDTLRDMQKGLKLHNAFVHWRHTGAEVWCGILYFVVALLDKWVALVSGGSIVGLSNASSETFRLPVGFGLAYYLIAAVFLDGVAQPLWILAQKNTPQAITSLEFLQKAAVNDVKAKRKLYWISLVEFLLLHVWGLSTTAALMWSFNATAEGTIMYLAYIGAYTGLLWYQYNRIYTGPLALKDLLVAGITGLLTGILLHTLSPGFTYNSVIALAVGTWTAAVLSLFTSGVLFLRLKTDGSRDIGKNAPVFHCGSALGDHSPISQTTQLDIFDSVLSLPDYLRYRLDPMCHPGVEVLAILRSRTHNIKYGLIKDAFPSSRSLIEKTIELWQRGKTVIDLVPARHLIEQDQKMRSISRLTDDQLHILVFIGLDLVGNEWSMNISRNCQVVAEALIQATAESKLGFSHDHSQLAQSLVVSQTTHGTFVPESIRRQLENSAADRARIGKNGEKIMLRYLLLGVDADIDWESLPKTIRSFLLQRCYGHSHKLTIEEFNWIKSRCCNYQSLDVKQYIARCNLGATVAGQINDFAEVLEIEDTYKERPETPTSMDERCVDVPLPPDPDNKYQRLSDYIVNPLHSIFNTWKLGIKFIAVSLVADPEFQRELNYLLQGKPRIIRWPVVAFLNGIWLFCRALQQLILPFFIFHGRQNVSKLYRNMKGMRTIVEKNRILVENFSGASTCFQIVQPDGTSKLYQYSGVHDTKPEGLNSLMSINTYSGKLILREREEYSNQSLVNRFTYDYSTDATGNGPQLPLERHCVEGKLNRQIVRYDNRGYITAGSAIRDGSLVEFKFWYRKNARFDDELLRGEYVFPHITMTVQWSVPHPSHAEDVEKWIPHSKVMSATFTQGTETYISNWTYDHKFHPVISTTLNGFEIETPEMIRYDWFKVLEKPQNCSFINDNPIFSFNSIKPRFLSRLLHLNVQRYPISTGRARTQLWKAWKSGKALDAVTARWLDERVLRSDSTLKPYWRARNLNRLDVALKYVEERSDTIMARTDIDPEISSWTPLAYKISDFSSFGQGGDTRINTRTVSSQLHDTRQELHVLAMDTGTWPNEGGGVSACRRDMVNDLQTIRWHILAENANDFGVPKFQIEKNVQSLTVLPLWGLDFLTPTHGVFQDFLDSEVQERSNDTMDRDIKRKFLPMLRILVKCSRALKLTREHLEEASKALLDLNTYFESTRHWGDVWKSDIVKNEWRRLWLTENMENTRPLSQWLEAEKPTLLHLDNALDMWHRYLFIFSVPVPETIPDVFQASHHFAGASYGVLCKLKRHCTLHVWDHCISWREVTVFLSSAMSFDAPFVCNSLMSLSRLTSVLILHHADVVLPCADFFNPGWEVEIGSQEGTLCHRNSFARKIDPVVNGICNMEKFKPIEEITSKVPTVVMLSHVRFVKDIKTAVLAADIIVKEWGFSDYQLHIYGDMEKAPTYAVECQEIIASKGLRDNVILKGLGSPSKVLESAWVFLNSSVSEGLPLAMGEAALTGVPIVCTDVGASFRVVTDMKTGKPFSAVVAPNDALSLARAQINVMGLLEEWAPFADDPAGFVPPSLGQDPRPEDVKMIRARMDQKKEQRRKMGMMGRKNVFENFSCERYLREHEQMLWVGKYQSPSWRAKGVDIGKRKTVVLPKYQRFADWDTEKPSGRTSIWNSSGRGSPHSQPTPFGGSGSVTPVRMV